MKEYLWVEKDVILFRQNKAFCCCKFFKINKFIWEKIAYEWIAKINPAEHFDFKNYIKTYMKFIDI